MTTQTTGNAIPTAPSGKSRNLPPGYRVLHVQVPEEIFNGAKAGALLQGIDWPRFVVKLLEEADPRKGQGFAKQPYPAPSTK